MTVATHERVQKWICQSLGMVGLLSLKKPHMVRGLRGNRDTILGNLRSQQTSVKLLVLKVYEHAVVFVCVCMCVLQSWGLNPGTCSC